MPRTSDKRERLVDAALTLFHHQGYGQTSLADIAEQSGVPLGNVYYYFKTKDDIANAVIEERMRQQQAFLEQCEQSGDPQASLFCFLDLLDAASGDISKFGCPIGGLCQELNKDETLLSKKTDALLGLALKWVEKQFGLLGHKNAEQLAQHAIATVHGASLLANTFNKPSIIKEEIARIKAWIKTL